MPIYAVVATICGWYIISKFQGNFVIFTTISNYIVMKLIWSFILGVFITPFYGAYLLLKLVVKILKFFFGGSKNQQQEKGNDNS